MKEAKHNRYYPNISESMRGSVKGLERLKSRSTMKLFPTIIIIAYSVQPLFGQTKNDGKAIEEFKALVLQIDSAIATIDTAVYLIETFYEAHVNSKMSDVIPSQKKSIYGSLKPLAPKFGRPKEEMLVNKYVETLVKETQIEINKIVIQPSNIAKKQLYLSYKSLLHFANLLFQDASVRGGENFEEGLWQVYHMYRIRHDEVKDILEMKSLNEASDKRRIKSDTVIGKQLSVARLFKSPQKINDASKYLTKNEVETALANPNYRVAKRNLKRLVRRRKGTNFLGLSNFI